jgi:hypothetical protein
MFSFLGRLTTLLAVTCRNVIAWLWLCAVRPLVWKIYLVFMQRECSAHLLHQLTEIDALLAVAKSAEVGSELTLLRITIEHKLLDIQRRRMGVIDLQPPVAVSKSLIES